VPFSNLNGSVNPLTEKVNQPLMFSRTLCEVSVATMAISSFANGFSLISKCLILTVSAIAKPAEKMLRQMINKSFFMYKILS
jgi:hypothetical protein